MLVRPNVLAIATVVGGGATVVGGGATVVGGGATVVGGGAAGLAVIAVSNAAVLLMATSVQYTLQL